LYLKKMKEKVIYFAPIGKVYEDPVPWDVGKVIRDNSFVLPCRTVLLTSTETFLSWNLKPLIPHYVTGDWVYFFCSIPSNHRYQFSVSTLVGMSLGSISFQDESNLSYHTPYMKCAGGTMLIMDTTRSVSYCKCSLTTLSDLAVVVSHWFASSCPSVTFLQELFNFACLDGSVSSQVWKGKSPGEIRVLSQGSDLRLVDAFDKHCVHFDPSCKLCGDSVFNASNRLFVCGHRRDILGPTYRQKYAFKPNRESS